MDMPGAQPFKMNLKNHKKPIFQLEHEGSNINTNVYIEKFEFAPPRSLLELYLNDNKTTYEYPIFVSTVTLGFITGILLSAPSEMVLKLINGEAKGNHYIYYRVNLYPLCHDQYLGSSNINISITRLNLRWIYEATKAVSSITLYGKNVVNSDAFRFLTQRYKELAKDDPSFKHNWGDMEDTPFVPIEKLPNKIRLIEPKALKLTYQTASEKNESALHINIDSFGNFAFQINGLDGISKLVIFLEYLHKVGSQSTTEIYPLLRPSEALSRINT